MQVSLVEASVKFQWPVVGLLGKWGLGVGGKVGFTVVVAFDVVVVSGAAVVVKFDVVVVSVAVVVVAFVVWGAVVVGLVEGITISLPLVPTLLDAMTTSPVKCYIYIIIECVK